MRIANLLHSKAVLTDLQAQDKDQAIQQLVQSLQDVMVIDSDMVMRDIAARERSGTTLIPAATRSIAIPHASTAGCKQLLLAVGISSQGIPWDSAGRKAHVVFLLLGPPQTHSLYLRVLGRIARLCQNEAFIDGVLACGCPQEVVERFGKAEEPLGEIAAVAGMPSFCVIGAGHGGLAMAAHLSITGCKVNLYNRTQRHIEMVQVRGGIDVEGEVKAFAAINMATSDAAQAIDNVDIIMVVVPATAHRDVAETIAPHLKDGQIVVLNPGRTGGALEVLKVLRERNPAVRPFVAEAQTLLYASRATNPGQVHIYRIKNSVPLATLPAYQIADVLPVIRRALPQFVPGDNVLKTSMDNIGAIFHPAITILNAGRIEDTHGAFEYYVQGVTPAVASVLEALDRERVAVASALGIRANTAREWLYLAYDAPGKTLLDAMRANTGYSGIMAPATIQNRYISEDVPASLVPIASIGEMLGVPCPTMRTMIQMASIMHDVDYWKEGRTVDRLGIKGMSVKDIRFLVVGAVIASASQTVGSEASTDDAASQKPVASAAEVK